VVWYDTRVIISTEVSYITPLFQMVVGAGRDGSTGIPFMGPPQLGYWPGVAFAVSAYIRVLPGLRLLSSSSCDIELSRGTASAINGIPPTDIRSPSRQMRAFPWCRTGVVGLR
jgi:hypothetical protein